MGSTATCQLWSVFTMFTARVSMTFVLATCHDISCPVDWLYQKMLGR